MTATVAKVLGALLALAIGIWIGMPGKAPGESRARRGGPGDGDGDVHSEEGLRELELLLGRTGARSRGAKRHFTPLDLLRKERRGSHRRRSRRYFRTTAPEVSESPGPEAKAEGRSE